jgi:hypothetical protein
MIAGIFCDYRGQNFVTINEEGHYIYQARETHTRSIKYERLLKWYAILPVTFMLVYGLYLKWFGVRWPHLDFDFVLLMIGLILLSVHKRSLDTDQSGSQQELKLVEFLETKLADSASEVNIITNNDSDYIQQARAICDRGHQFERICKWCFLSLYTLLFVHELYFWGTSDYRLDFTYAATIHIVGTILSHFRSWNSDQSGSQHELKLIEFLEAKLVEAEVGKKAEN